MEVSKIRDWVRILNQAKSNPSIAKYICDSLAIEMSDFADSVDEQKANGPQTHREDLEAMCADWIADNFDEAMKYYRDGVSDAEEDVAEGQPNWRSNAPKVGGVFGNDQLHVDAYNRGYDWGLKHASVAS